MAVYFWFDGDLFEVNPISACPTKTVQGKCSGGSFVSRRSDHFRNQIVLVSSRSVGVRRRSLSVSRRAVSPHFSETIALGWGNYGQGTKKKALRN